MKIKITHEFTLQVALDSVTNRWAAILTELPGCASAGDTKEEAIVNAREALALWFKAPASLLGRRGGKSKSSAKSEAARSNGKKGGRPKKIK